MLVWISDDFTQEGSSSYALIRAPKKQQLRARAERRQCTHAHERRHFNRNIEIAKLTAPSKKKSCRFFSEMTPLERLRAQCIFFFRNARSVRRRASNSVLSFEFSRYCKIASLAICIATVDATFISCVLFMMPMHYVFVLHTFCHVSSSTICRLQAFYFESVGFSFLILLALVLIGIGRTVGRILRLGRLTRIREILFGETLDAPTSLAVVPQSSPNLSRSSPLRHARGIVFRARIRIAVR